MSDCALRQTRHFAAVGLGAILGLYFLLAPAITASASDAPLTQFRRPAALVLDAADRYLYIANQRSGSLSVVDVQSREVVAEHAIGKKLVDLAWGPEQQLLVLDETAGELIQLSVAGPQVEVKQRLAVGPYPVGMAVSQDHSQLFVSLLWPRKLLTLTAAENQWKIARTQDTPFAPRKLLLIDDDSKLIVADSFSGRFHMLNSSSGAVIHEYSLPAHNIRGLGVSANGKMMLVAHQMLNDLAHSVHNDVHWGLLMSNDLRWLPLKGLIAGADDLYRGAHMHPLGDAGRAAADPAGLAVGSSGVVVVTLAGVNQVAVGLEDDFTLERIPVGRRPVNVVIASDNQFAYTVNEQGDSLSIVDLAERKSAAEISLGPSPKLTAVERGERLFFDGRLSLDGWMSCHSCHTDGHTNSQMSDNFSDGSFGAPKRVLSLLGKSGTEPFAWNAGSASYAEQVRKSISQTMQGSPDPPEAQIADLTAYLKTLQTPPGIDRVRGTEDKAAIERGGEIFAAQSCRDCHSPPNYTTPELYDVGLADKLGNKQFNPPSLRGVGQRGPYFHDNRAPTLRAVFVKHKHQLDAPLEEEQLAELLAFLRSL